ncbi:hypothetical protein C5167_050152 [Papaver somniferum]|uniref:Nal1 C-terminal domain-containing protein n=1 Tax=Papaver somniferum TaxID=3469 RepID=A0A4Y7KRR9_PAPSO|nr:hypothetical protein C5167_050152 [Papaver somniferum]
MFSHLGPPRRRIAEEERAKHPKPEVLKDLEHVVVYMVLLINSQIGKQVVKVGRSSGLTTGTITSYAFEYNDEKELRQRRS